MLPRAPAEHLLHGPAGVVVDAARFPGTLRLLIALPLLRTQGRGLQVGDRFLQNAPVPPLLQVLAQHIRQPQEVVADTGAHAFVPRAAGLVPPVHHISLPVLMGAGPQDLRPGQLRRDWENSANILKLVPESEGPAVLIEGSPSK